MLVTDLLMPGDSGWKLAQQLKTERPDMQLLLVSGYSPEGPDQVSIEGAHFMAKPFSGSDLRDRIRELTAPS